ncbi:MAG: hypothetical protein ACE5I9_02720 [Candidatus Methylomirabilales bacterium]
MIERQDDMEVVGEVLHPVDLLVAVRETEADVLILALKNSEEPGLCSHLLTEHPNLTILGLTYEGKSAFIEQLCPLRREIIDPSEAKILSALRHATRAPCSSEGEMEKGQLH